MSSAQPAAMDGAGAPAARELGFATCTALVIGNTIGMGVFVLPASLAPFGLNALGGWTIIVFGCVMLAIVFSGLARAFPQDSGPFDYTRRALGSGIAFTVLWGYWVSVVITNAALAIGVVGYLMVLWPILKSAWWLPPVTALALIWVCVLLNARGVRTAGAAQILTTALKLLPLVGIMLLGLWQLIVHPRIYLAQVPPNPFSGHELQQSAAVALYAMLGIESAMIPAGRVRDPARTIPRATLVGTLLTALICMCASILPMLLLPQATLARSDAPFAELFGRLVGGGSGGWISAFVAISGIGCLNGWTLLVGELTQSLAQRGSFPAWLGRVNGRAAPVNAFVLTAALASAMLLLAYNESTAGTFTFLTEVITAANLPLYFACALAALLLWRQGSISRSATSAGFAWAAAFAAAFCVYALIGFGLLPLGVALALMAAGIPVHLWFARRPAGQPAVGASQV